MKQNPISRRAMLARSAAALGAATVVPASVLGREGQPAANDRIVLGAIGIGGRGSGVLRTMMQVPGVQVVANCDVRADRRETVKRMIDTHYGNRDCQTYRDFIELLARTDVDAVLITTGSNWHATLSIYAAKAGKDVYCEKPCTKNIAESLALAETFRRAGRVYQAGTQRRNGSNFVFAIELARQGRLGRLRAVHACCGGGTGMSGFGTAHPEPPKEEIDWDRYLGPAAWRPYPGRVPGSGFEKGGGMVGGGVLEWGSHCVDLCQWAADADDTVPVEYAPAEGSGATARYADGVKLVMRRDGWIGLGSCPVRFEGETGWVETGDSGKVELFPETLRAWFKKPARDHGALGNHVRDFFNCVRSRGLPRANHLVACQSHIACHAANIAMFLDRELAYDPKKNEFIDDEQANRLRSEALREPWRL